MLALPISLALVRRLAIGGSSAIVGNHVTMGNVEFIICLSLLK